MFCALNGATRMPRRRSQAQIAVAIQLLPACDETPPTKMGFAFTARRSSAGLLWWRFPIHGKHPSLPAVALHGQGRPSRNTSRRSPTTRFRRALAEDVSRRKSATTWCGLILPGGDYAGAAARLREWIAEGILAARRRRPRSSSTSSVSSCPKPHEPLVRRRFIGLGDLEEYGDGVHRHERTLDAPKADRLELLRHTRAQFGSIFDDVC